MGATILFVFYSHHTVGDETIFALIKNDVANPNGRWIKRLNCNYIFMTYGRIHAVAWCSKTDEFAGAKKFNTNLSEVKGLRTED